MVSVIPINNRKPTEILRGLKLIFEQLGKPKQLYSDEESSLRSQEFLDFINENSIQTVQALTHAHGIGRFIKTFRMKLQRRLDALNQNKNEWVKHVKNVVGKYNNMVHSTIQINPNEAAKPSNHLWVVWHLQNAAKKNREYEEIKQSGMVGIMVKRQVR